MDMMRHGISISRLQHAQQVMTYDAQDAEYSNGAEMVLTISRMHFPGRLQRRQRLFDLAG